MRIKTLTICLILLGCSINIQAQSTIDKKSFTTSQVVKTPSKATTLQQTKDNIKRRNMAKYKAMSQKSNKKSIVKKGKSRQRPK